MVNRHVILAAVVFALGCGAAQAPQTHAGACRQRSASRRMGRSINPDPRLDAFEEAQCDDVEREERRLAVEERRREEDRRERAEARRELMAASAPPLALAPGTFDLTGIWIGDYGGGRIETVKIEQTGVTVSAKKITGDTNVPAGKPTFSATLAGAEGDGSGHAADDGYQNPRWHPGRLRVFSADECDFTWGTAGSGFTVRFKRVK